jgi:hypothetical protein
MRTLILRCMAFVLLFSVGCGGAPDAPEGDSPHKVYVMLGFHGNFYHSWRGDTPDEAGFGQDIRIVREILRMLDEANAAGLDARGYWDVENLFTYEEILPKHAPDIIEGIRRRITAGRDEALLMPYDNGLIHAMTEDELRANVRWAISNPWGSGVRDLFGTFTPLFRPQEMTLTTGILPYLAEEGVEGLIMLWAGVPFNALSSFAPPIPVEQRYGVTRLRLHDDGPATLLLPAGSVGDIVDHVSLEAWLLDLRALQTRGDVDRDLVIHINADADGDFWLPVKLPPGLSWLPNAGGLEEHIEAVNKYEWAAFTTPGEFLADHPPEGEVLVRQDIADGGWDGQYSWAEKFASHGIWTVLEQSRIATWRADALAVGAPDALAAAADALLRGGRDSSFFHRVRGLSTTHFGMSTPIVNEERQAVAERVVGAARDRARSAEALLARHTADSAPLVAGALYTFEVRDVRTAAEPGPARSLVRLPLLFDGPPPTTELLDATGTRILHSLATIEDLGDGRFAAELWSVLTLEAGERTRLSLRSTGTALARDATAPVPAKLDNAHIELALDPVSGIASLTADGQTFGGPDFLSAFVSYGPEGDVQPHPNEAWVLSGEDTGPWLQRAHLRTRIPFATPEDGDVAADVAVALSLPGDAPWVVADVQVTYPYTTKRDILHNPAQKLRRYLDRRWVEVAPFQLHPLLEGDRDDPLRVWKHNYLGITSYYDLDYARINPKNAEIDAFNHQVTAGWVAASDGQQGLLVAEDADVRSSFAFAPMRLRERNGRQALWLNPFGSYHGHQLDYSQGDGTGVGAEITALFASSLHPNGPSYNGEHERFSLLLAPYAGDAPDPALQRAAGSFFASPAVVYLTAPRAAHGMRLAHEVSAQIAAARRSRARARSGPLPTPRAFLANPTAGAVNVVWDEPDDPRIDGYEVAWRPAADAEWTLVRIEPARRHRVDGLEDGAAYAFRVRAFAQSGAGPWTDQEEVRVAPVEVVKMANELFAMSPGLMWRFFKGALVHAWATR